MKVQDIGFLSAFILILAIRNPRVCALAGIACLVVAIPLFATWTFFTAERLTWYAGAFIALGAVLSFKAARKVQ